MISIVAAMDLNGVIGYHHTMPWHCSEDLAHFRNLTLHQHILMGRITYEHLPKQLDHRILHIASRKQLTDENIMLCHDVEKEIKKWKDSKQSLYVCGGAQIYETALPYADELWLTTILNHYQGDTWFPNVDLKDFILVSEDIKKECVIRHYIKR